jgi:hypothetical protein
MPRLTSHPFALALCVGAIPLALAGCSSRKSEMMSAIRHHLDKPGNRLTYCADLMGSAESPYYNTILSSSNSFYPVGFAATISKDHPIAYVGPAATASGPGIHTAAPKLPAVVAWWLRHHLLDTRTIQYHDGQDFSGPVLAMAPVTLYFWKHEPPKALIATATINQFTGHVSRGFFVDPIRTSIQVPWTTSYCGGRVTPLGIVSSTAPTAENGVTVSTAKVRFAVRGLPAYFYDKSVQKELRKVAPQHRTIETVQLVRTSNGWSVRKIGDAHGIVPIRDVAEVRQIAGGVGGL